MGTDEFRIGVDLEYEPDDYSFRYTVFSPRGLLLFRARSRAVAEDIIAALELYYKEDLDQLPSHAEAR